MDAYAPRILIVDDSIDTADSLTELVNLWGFDAEAHYSGAAALASARLHRPDVVLLDLVMPRMCGFDFIRHLRKLRGGEKIAMIVISGYSDNDNRQRARSLGIDRYLVKPVDLKNLMALLVRLSTPLRLSREGISNRAGRTRLETSEEASRWDVEQRCQRRTDTSNLLPASGNSPTGKSRISCQAFSIR